MKIDTFDLADLRRLEKALSGPLDTEWEAYRAAQYRYTKRGRLLVPTRPGPGAMLMPPSVVTLFANSQAGAALVSFTTEASMYAATQPNAILGANYFDPTYSLNRTIRVICRGIFSTTATPTYTLGFRQDTAAGAIWGTSLAITSQSTVTNVVWELEFDVTVASILLASAHNEVTLVTFGQVSGVSSTVAGTGFTNGSAIGTQTPTTAQTLTQTDVSHFLFPTATCGTSSASNKWQMLQMLVQGMN